MDSFWRSMKRLGRALVSVGVLGGAAYLQKDPKLLVWAPVLQAVGKFLRDKFGLKYIPF